MVKPAETLGDEARGPLQRVAARRIEGAQTRSVAETLAMEVPVAMQFNGRAYAVMLATPADLEDFALGFALTEGIVRRPEELTLVDVAWTPHGVTLAMQIPDVRAALLDTRDRNLTGRTGCGLCGTSTLEAAIRPVRHVDPATPRASVSAIAAGMARLAAMQPYNSATGAVHAAALICADEDKAAGAVMRAGGAPHSLLVTSRASYEVVHKAAEVGCRLVAAISAPTALAVELAQQAGVTLAGWVRPPRLTVYCGELE